MSHEAFIVGCGYTGLRVAIAEGRRGRRVYALARSAEAVGRLRAAEVEPVTGDLDQPASLRAVDVTRRIVYYFAPPPATGTTDQRIEIFLSSITSPALPERVVLISTTSIYGDCRGRWIDEDCPPNPQTERARRRLAAETTLQAWGRTTNVPVVILRVAGIYGPGRLPVERLQRGLPALREEESPWSNRIHIDDLVSACPTAADRGRPGGVYNVSDGNPSTMTDYFNRTADALGLPRPPQVPRKQAQRVMGAEMLSYLSESRRLDNTRMRHELGIILRYPTLETGLKASVDETPGVVMLPAK
jgi:nucleoside-diphosphate-sugar epimerase